MLKNYILETAYHDLCGIIYLIQLKENKKYAQVPVYSLLRDACLIIYQINKEILNSEFVLDPKVKKIRHKVKLYNKGNNKLIYQKILQNSIHQFGDDIDNIGLYFEGDKLVGSTIFHQYLFLDTDILGSNPKSTQKNAIQFAKYVGSIAAQFAFAMKKEFVLSPIQIDSIPPFQYKDAVEYTPKDVHYFQLYKNESISNVIITRLLLILQEVTFCLWLHKGIKFSGNSSLTLDNYIALRLISIKVDEVMDNLKNIRKFLKTEFNELDKQCKMQFTKIIKRYDQKLNSECTLLRNLLHYDFKGENFFDYLIKMTAINPKYSEEIIWNINTFVMQPLSEVISEYFKADTLRSMSVLEKYGRRILTLLKGNHNQ